MAKEISLCIEGDFLSMYVAMHSLLDFFILPLFGLVVLCILSVLFSVLFNLLLQSIFFLQQLSNFKFCSSLLLKLNLSLLLSFSPIGLLKYLNS